jgi:YD repeat-containing protein
MQDVARGACPTCGGRSGAPLRCRDGRVALQLISRSQLNWSRKTDATNLLRQTGRQIAIRDERGYINSQAYDLAGNLVRETHADGGVITHAYDIFGQKVQTVDAVGNAAGGSTKTDHTTSHAYDKAGRLVRTTHGTTVGGSVSVLVLSGGLTLVEDSLRKNLTESFTYDEAGRKLTQTNGQGETIRYWYDRAGNVIRLRQPLGQESRTGYNAWGFKASAIDANGVGAD